MLVSVLALVQGAATDEVKIAAADRMEFDADFAKGLLKRRATSIVQAAPKHRKRKKPLPE